MRSEKKKNAPRSSMLCHPDRSEAEWRDLRFCPQHCQARDSRSFDCGVKHTSAQDDNSQDLPDYFAAFPTNFFSAFTFVRSSSGSSMGVSAMNAALASRGSFSKRRNAGRPMLPFPIC